MFKTETREVFGSINREAEIERLEKDLTENTEKFIEAIKAIDKDKNSDYITPAIGPEQRVHDIIAEKASDLRARIKFLWREELKQNPKIEIPAKLGEIKDFTVNVCPCCGKFKNNVNSLIDTFNPVICEKNCAEEFDALNSARKLEKIETTKDDYYNKYFFNKQELK